MEKREKESIFTVLHSEIAPLLGPTWEQPILLWEKQITPKIEELEKEIPGITEKFKDLEAKLTQEIFNLKKEEERDKKTLRVVSSIIDNLTSSIEDEQLKKKVLEVISPTLFFISLFTSIAKEIKNLQRTQKTKKTEKFLKQILPQKVARLILPEHPPLSSSPSPFKKNGLAPFASSAPAFGATKAIFSAPKGWPTDDQGIPRYVFEIEGDKLKGKFIYYIILPWDATDEEITIAHKELAWEILKKMGPDTVWLHMLLLAYSVDPTRRDRRTSFVIPKKEIYKCLGLDKRSDLADIEKTRRALEEIKKLRHLGIQIVHLQWVGTQKIKYKGKTEEANVFNFNRSVAPLWELTIHEFGQALLLPLKDDENKILLTHEDWQLVGREGLWGDIFLHGDKSLRQFGYVAREMLEKIDRYHCPWGASLAVMLTFYSRFHPSSTIKISNREIIQFVGEEITPANPKKRYDIKVKVINALLEQQKWGWELDYSLWPEYLRPDKEAEKADNTKDFPWDAYPKPLPPGYWEDFLNCETIFKPTQSAKEMLEANQQVRNMQAITAPKTSISKRIETGSDVRELRKRLGMTQKELANYLGISRAQLANIEAGRRNLAPSQRKKLQQLEQKS
jgi:DNA-binding transcriptional regulator YiaG